MLRLSTCNSTWKSSLFRPICYQISRKKLSKRGVVRFLKAKKIKLKARWALEKAERQALGEILPEPYKSLQFPLDPDVPKGSFTFLENSESFFSAQALRQNIEVNLNRIEEAFPLGINDLGSFLGYRSGIQKQHFERVLNAILTSQQLTVQEMEEKLCSFIKLAKTLKLHDLFRREHFEFMLGNDMVTSLESLIELQKDSPNNLFTPELASMLIKYVSENTLAFFLLENLKYCSVITEGVRPTKDAAPIDYKGLYHIFDPEVMKTQDILPVAHSIMYIFPQTFMKTFNIHGLFLKQMLSISIADRRDEEIQNSKFIEMEPEIFDPQVFQHNALYSYVQQNNLNEQRESDRQKIQKAKKLLYLDDENYEIPTESLVQTFGTKEEESQKELDRLYRQGRIDQDEKKIYQIAYSRHVVQRQVQQPSKNKKKQNKDELKINPMRFDPRNDDNRFYEIFLNKQLSVQQAQKRLVEATWDKVCFQVQKAELQMDKNIQQIQEQERINYQEMVAARDLVVQNLTNQQYYTAKRKAQKKYKKTDYRLSELGEEMLQGLQVIDLPEILVQHVKEVDEQIRQQYRFSKYNPDFPEEEEITTDFTISQSEGMDYYENQKLGSQQIRTGGYQLHQQSVLQILGSKKKSKKLAEIEAEAAVQLADVQIDEENIVQQGNNESEWVNPQNQGYNVTQEPSATKKVHQVQNPDELKWKGLKVNELSSSQIITEEIEEQTSDVNQPENQSAVPDQPGYFYSDEDLKKIEQIREGQYQINDPLQRLVYKYLKQNQQIVRFLAEVFFNTPDFEHGLKSVNLCYLILYRLTYYAETLTPENKINIKDLLSLATSNQHYEDLFTTKLSDVLHGYTINKVNIGELYDKILDNYSFENTLMFEPVIITQEDRLFYSANKVIQYGKFYQQIDYKAEPEEYLTREQVFESQDNRTNTEQHPVQIKDIVDSYNQKRTQGGYTYETINLMESVLSRSSNGMYKLFKKTINQYSNSRSQLADQLKVENLKNLTNEQLSMLGLSKMTDILYKRSVPLTDSEIFEAIMKRNIKQNSPIDALLEVNAQLRQKQGATETDFFVPEYEKYGDYLKHKIVDPNNPLISEFNQIMMRQDDNERGRLEIDNSLRQKFDLEMQSKEFEQQLQNFKDPKFMQNFLKEYGTPGQKNQNNAEKSQQVQQQKAQYASDEETQRRLVKKLAKKKQWHEDQKRYDELYEKFYTMVEEQKQIFDIPRTKEGKIDIEQVYYQHIEKIKQEFKEALQSDQELLQSNSEQERLISQGQFQKAQQLRAKRIAQARLRRQKQRQEEQALANREQESKGKQKIKQIKFDKTNPQRNFKKIKQQQKPKQSKVESLDLSQLKLGQQQPKKTKKIFVTPQQNQKKQKQLEQKQKRIQRQKRRQNEIKQQQLKQQQRQRELKRIEEERLDQQKRAQKGKKQNWYNRGDESILNILDKTKKKQPQNYQNFHNVPSESVHFRALSPFDDTIQPETPQRQQTKHDKRAAHQARKHFKRRDTEPDLTDKEIKQSLPFRADKQKNLHDDKTPRNNFSTMKPKFKFSTIKKHSSSLAQLINSSPTLESACEQIKNIFRRNNNSETLKELMKIPDLQHFKTGTQCALAIFFYHEGLPLAESQNLKGSFNTSMGEIEVDYNKYLKTTLFDFELGDTVYIKLLQHLKTNFNRSLFKKVLAHIVRYANAISFQLATQITSFVTEVNVPMTHLEFINLVTLNDLRLNLSTLMVLLSPLSNYAQTSKDVYILYKTNMLKLGWALSLQPLQNYIIKLNRAGEQEYVSHMVEDIRSVILSRKFKLTDKNISSEQNKRLQTEFKEQLKKEQLKYVIETAAVLGFTGCFVKAEQLFDQYKQATPELTKQQVKTGFYCYTMNSTKFQQLLNIVNKNKDFITVDMYIRILQPIKKASRNKVFLDKVLETFIYSGIIQKSLTAVEINQTIEAFIRSKNTNSYPRLLEHLLKYELKLDEQSHKLFYNVIKEAHTTADSKRMIVNLLDIIFNKDREEERKSFVQIRERQEEKKRKLDELKENQLKRIKNNLEELEKLTKQAAVNKQEVTQTKTSKKQSKSEKKQQTKVAETAPVPASPTQPVATLPGQQKKGSKSQKGKKKQKDEEKVNKIALKEDRKAKSKLYQQDAPQNKRKDIIPQELRLAVTPKQMRRGGRKKFFFLAMTQQQIKDDEAAREAMKRKRH